MLSINNPSVISFIVTVGFFAVLFLFLTRPIAMNDAAWTALNIMLGALGAQFANVVQYSIGSSSASKAKDDTIKALTGTGPGTN